MQHEVNDLTATMTQPDTSRKDAPSADPDTAEAAAAPTTVILDLVSVDGGDPQQVASAASMVGAQCRLFSSADSWFEHAARPTAAGDWTDVVVFVGDCGRIGSHRHVARARAAAPDASIAVACPDGSLQQLAVLVGQGVNGLIALSSMIEGVSKQLAELIEPARRGQSIRRATASHRKALSTLTSAESDVLDLMLDGLANKQIAQRLSIGLRTVELRRSKIMRKMEASSVAQLISYVWAARHVC